jgi:uncharacterized protein (TIGR02594 family)
MTEIIKSTPKKKKPKMDPKWLAEARKELGTKEGPGSVNNPKVVKFWDDAKLSFIKDDATPWCAGFANAMLERAGLKGTRKANARSFMAWGVRQSEPRLGSVCVLSRPPSPWQGHVGFVVSHDKDTVTLVGGNQGDSVSYSKFKKTRVLGYRWPDGIAETEPLLFSDSVAAESKSEA